MLVNPSGKVTEVSPVHLTNALTPMLVKRPFLTGAALGLTLAVIAIASFGDSYGGGYSQAKSMLELASPQHGEIATVSWYYPFAKAGASFVSLISGIPGGLFDPSLAVGASLGQVLHPLFDNDFVAPGIGLPELMMLFMAAYFNHIENVEFE